MGGGGEIGHITVNYNETETCGCGRKGCLEMYASATGIARLARRRLAKDEALTVLRDFEVVTAKEVFVQLTILQKQLTENSQTSLHRLGVALSSLEGEDCEARFEQIPEICDVFKTRELTLLKMLEMYEKMYDDVQNEETKKVNLVKSAFDNNMAMITDSDMETQDKFAALGYVTDKIAELVEKIVVDK